jgi:hypothetical protein
VQVMARVSLRPQASRAWRALRPSCYRSVLPHPFVADLLVLTFHRRPGDAEGGFLLTGVVRVGRVGVVEGLAKNVLGMLGQDLPTN